MKLAKTRLSFLLFLLILGCSVAFAQNKAPIVESENHHSTLTTSSEGEYEVLNSSAYQSSVEQAIVAISEQSYFTFENIIDKTPLISSKDKSKIFNTAIRQESTKALEYLLNIKFQKDIEDNDLYGLIHVAIQFDNVKNYELLIQHFPNQSKNNKDFLFSAARNDKFNVFYHIFTHEDVKNSKEFSDGSLLAEATETKFVLDFLNNQGAKENALTTNK